MNGESGQCVKPMTAADEIRRLCEKVSEKSNELAKLTADKLSPLYVQNPPSIRGLEEAKDQRAYPPYFDGLRGLLVGAISALDDTSRIINKVDI